MHLRYFKICVRKSYILGYCFKCLSILAFLFYQNVLSRFIENEILKGDYLKR